MSIRQLKVPTGAKKKPKIVGRGPGSGHGKTSTRGHKGQWARSGGGVSPFFEGGQTPFHRRIPKVGFKSLKQKFGLKDLWKIVNVEDLNIFPDGSTVNIDKLVEKGLIKSSKYFVKLLGNGELKVKNLTIEVHSASKSAIQKVEANGGKVILLPLDKKG